MSVLPLYIEPPSYMYKYSFSVDLLIHLQYYRCSFLIVDSCNGLHKSIAFILPNILGFKLLQSVLFARFKGVIANCLMLRASYMYNANWNQWL